MQNIQKCLLLLFIALLTWMPLFQAGFIWDDDTLVTQNPLVLSTNGIYKCWISLDCPDYIPLTLSSFWIEWRLWKGNATGYHITNMIIHLLTCVGIAFIFAKLNWKGGWIAAILYAVHPVNVESVAWISQRKNVLCFLFTLLSIYCFVSAHQKNHPPIYSIIFFLCSLLCKAASIMLPIWLLFLLYFHFKQPVQRSFFQIFPLLILSAIFSVVTLFFQYGNAMEHEIVRSDSMIERLMFVFQAFLFYLSKAIFPNNLCFVYAIQTDDIAMILGFCIFWGFTYFLYRTRNHRYATPAILAFSFYVLNLLPVIGFFDIYFMRFSWVADHWQSLSLMGITSISGAYLGVKLNEPSTTKRIMALSVTALLVGLLALKTNHQCKLYKTERLLWENTLQCNSNSILPHDRMALIAVENKQYDLAEHHLKTSISIDANNWEAHMNLGNLYRRTKRYEQAKQQYLAALSINPKRPEIHINFGNLNIMTGQYDHALIDYQNALTYGAENAYVHYQLGMVYIQKKIVEKALYHFQKAIDWDSNFVPAYFYAGKLLTDIRPFDAIRHLEICIQKKHFRKQAHYLLGKIYAKLCRCRQAIFHFKKAGKFFETDHLSNCGCMNE